ncbi:ubiquitin-associated protein 1 [Colossoma macropomum]|uniref:ubiquitin-associated protein 1 n=1 Tax=Colossoma macropomum TaxID=42526 RepID=UPI001864F177|nr:ubiquitin-associated protein 1 [Colossoma macropomum]XP_036444082.1 ubiquitin-associated protein 1 [Colossoma macropomum]
MAARKSGSDIHNNGPISYLDDVPFKLNDKFRCPAKVGLPIGFCLPDCHSLLSDMQYDFSLEKRSVCWGEGLAKVRADEAQAAELRRVESEKDRQAASQDSDAGLAGGKKAHPTDEQDLLPPALNPVLAGLRHNAILTPLPAPSFGPAQPAPNNPAPQSLNLADFEREEDPFDKLELKTLDDKEELRSILQSQPHSSISAPEPPPPEPRPASQSNTPPLQAKSALFHKPNGLIGLLDLERPGGGGVVATRGQIDAERPCNIRSLTFPKLSDPGDSPSEPPLNLYPAAPPRSLPNGTPPSLLRSIPHTNSSMPGELSGHAPNGTPKQSSPVPAAGPPSHPTPASEALLSLSPSERQCVETIVGMGYSYEGVLKAMQRQGQNVEQVLEYLFVHSRLCERGFDATTVEECLEMYQCSEEKALQFLQLMSQFGEMGFERDAIKEVLLVHNNDQDKALEDLMARAAAS